MIQSVLEELIDNIVNTYKFTTLPNVSILKHDCLVELTTILNKFDKTKGSKAFAYFTVCAKNFFKRTAKKNAKTQKSNIQHDEVSKSTEIEFMSIELPYYEERNQKEFLETLWKEIDGWHLQDLKPSEKRVLEAIKILLKDPDYLENTYNGPGIFSKKAIYLYLRTLTGFNTKQVINSLKKFRKNYDDFKQEWNN